MLLNAVLNNGLVYTTDSCIGCNKCIKVCPCKGVNQIIESDDKRNRVIKVRGNECIACGECIRECNHGARKYEDDTELFFEDLGKGEEISLLVAPSFLADEKEHKMIVGYLKHLGVKHIYSVAFGADIVTWLYVKYLEDKKYNIDNNNNNKISSMCPSIVSYILKYMPERIENLMPIVSPMMATAVFVKKYLGRKEKLAFLGPCVSKKFEFSYPGFENYLSYNLTFASLEDGIKGVDISAYSSDIELDHGIGCILPLKSGIKKSISNILGFKKVIYEIIGRDGSLNYLQNQFKENMENENLYFVSTLICQNSCMGGIGISDRMKNMMIEREHFLNEKSYEKEHTFSGALSTGSRMQKRDEIYETLDMKDFMITFENSHVVKQKKISQVEIDTMFEKMYKYTYDEKNINCSMCGYNTCIEMAEAIINGRNVIDNCVFYARKKMEREKGQVRELLNKMTEMNEELIASADLKSNFLANMSHEIRTPMNAILGMADIVLRGDLNDVEKEYVNQIRTAGKNLLDIINDILDFSKIESGNLELITEEYELSSMVRDVVNSVSWRAYNKKIDFFINVDKDVPKSMTGDVVRIRQILINIINNAIKFTNEGSVTVDVSNHVRDGFNMLKIMITDTGIGIKKEDINKIFKSFQQVDSKRNRNVEGTGLGLAISNMLVELMDGRLGVESEYGVGTTFTILLPQEEVSNVPCASINNKNIRIIGMIMDKSVEKEVKDAVKCLNLKYISHTVNKTQEENDYLITDITAYDAYKETIHQKYKKDRIIVVAYGDSMLRLQDVTRIIRPVITFELAKVLNGEELQYNVLEDESDVFNFIAPSANVLIVDDNKINLSVAKTLLEPLEMNITTAQSGREAIALLDKNQYDMIFMDHMMPELDGIETTKIIRSRDDDYSKNVPIVALTANALHGVKEKFKSEGMNGFVSKPIQIEDIVDEIRKWLPKEKIVDVDPTTFLERLKEKKKSYEKTLEEEKIEGLDIQAAMKYMGSEDVYLGILNDYINEIEAKTKLIRKTIKEKNIHRYTIEVHALATASRLVGANELSNKAKTLEGYGHKGDVESINKETEPFLEEYNSYYPKIKEYLDMKKVNTTDKKEENVGKKKKSIKKETLKNKLENLLELCDDCDSKRCMDMVNDLNEYNLNKKFTKRLEDLTNLLEELEFEDGMDIINEWINDL